MVNYLTTDKTAGDIQQLGPQAAGATGKAADAGHVHPNVVTSNPLTITDGSSKEYQFRTSGGALDLQAAGADLFVSVWSGYGFTGSQNFYIICKAATQKLYLVGAVNVSPNSFSDGPITLDPSTGNVAAASFTAAGNIDVTAAGSGLQVKEGPNCKQGTAVLTAGSVVVANTAVTASSRIFLTSNADGGTPGFLRVSARTAGTSFTITSDSGTDTSTVAYQIFEPG